MSLYNISIYTTYLSLFGSSTMHYFTLHFFFFTLWLHSSRIFSCPFSLHLTSSLISLLCKKGRRMPPTPFLLSSNFSLPPLNPFPSPLLTPPTRSQLPVWLLSKIWLACPSCVPTRQALSQWTKWKSKMKPPSIRYVLSYHMWPFCSDKRMQYMVVICLPSPFHLSFCTSFPPFMHSLPAYPPSPLLLLLLLSGRWVSVLSPALRSNGCEVEGAPKGCTRHAYPHRCRHGLHGFGKHHLIYGIGIW